MKQVILYLALILFSIPSFAEVTALVDRQKASIDEPIELSIRATSTTDANPDFSALETRFDIVQRTQSSNISIANNRARSIIEWRLVLFAKEAGNIEIPSITIGKEQTQPILLEINERKVADPDQPKELFMQTQISTDEVRVQEQVIYSFSIYSAVKLTDVKISEPKAKNASFTALGDYSREEKRIQGRPYEVYTKRFALIPEKSGTLDVISPICEAKVRKAIYGYNNRFIRPTRVKGENHQLKVLPIPDQVDPSTWLPVKKLTLSESFGLDKNEIMVGENLTRQVSVEVNGATGAQISPLLKKSILGEVKTYQDKPIIKTRTTQAGLFGTRQDSIVIVPTKTGSIRLPEVKIPWWNTETQSQEYATLPARTLKVVANPELQIPKLQPTKTNQSSDNHPIPTQSRINSSQSWLIYLLSLLTATFALTTFACLWFITKNKQGQATMQNNTTTKSMKEKTSANDYLRKLINQQQITAKELRGATLQWGQRFFQSKPQTLNQIASQLQTQSPKLASLVLQLDQCLYSKSVHELSEPELRQLAKQMMSLKASSYDQDHLVESSLPQLTRPF